MEYAKQAGDYMTERLRKMVELEERIIDLEDISSAVNDRLIENERRLDGLAMGLDNHTMQSRPPTHWPPVRPSQETVHFFQKFDLTPNQ